MTRSISNGILTAVINDKGAELQSLVYHNSEYLWEGDPKWWAKHAPVLFPIVGTLKDGQYKYQGQNYSMPRHGFARDMVFDVVDHSSASITFQLNDTPQSRASYPFSFNLRITYSIHENSLSTAFEVVNNATEIVYFSIGGHPAFALPQHFQDYSLVFEGDEDPSYSHLENGLLTNDVAILKTECGRLRLHESLFENDALVFRGITSKSVSLLYMEKPILKVEFTDFPDLGIWSIPGASFICLEPWSGYADTVGVTGELQDKPGIVHLNPAEHFSGQFTITIY